MPCILILDDRVTNQRILGKLAASVESDTQVHTFGDPLETLAWLQHNEADLIVTDFKMPHLDGAEFTRRIRQIPAAADVPVVVVTVYDDRDFRLLALDAGATDFLLAPVDHVEFRTRVRNLLTLRRHQVEARRQADLLRRDLEASEQLRSALARESRDALAQLIDTVPALISACDRDGRLLFVNAAQAAEMGAEPADFVGRDRSALFGPERAALSAGLDQEVFTKGEALPGFEETATTPAGTLVHYFTTKAPMRDAHGQVVAVLSTSVDITARKQAEERLLHLARHDPLTALPNRAFLADRLRERCARGRRSDEGFALHFLDLVRFKAVNDALGHQAGDRLLVLVARRLRSALRQADLVARLGGDEFAILQPDAQSAADAAHLAERVMAAFERPFRIMGRSIPIAASIGITLFPQDAADGDELLRNADLAMYRTKRAGGSGFGFFDAGMEAAARETLQLESELRAALAHGGFELAWQPQVSLRDGRITGAEALLRWRHPTRGLMGPETFLPLAEEVGLITPITEWVLRSACAQGLAWRNALPGPLRVSANLSPSLFLRHDVVAMVQAALAETGLPHELLDLEITERVLVEKMEETAGTLRALRAAGLSFSIDDFGTGYSSLSYVKNLPVQRLKIDRAFISGVAQDPADAAIVAAVVGLAHGLGMEVVAEGVETREQLAVLRRLGCDEVQGFIVCRPLPAAEFHRLLEDGFTLPEAA